jgi:enoyl-CoA hydratase/carnithine racemase
MTEYRSVHLTIDDGLAELVLNRPQQLNAMTAAMAAEIGAAVDEAVREDARVLLVTAAGRGFSAGRDIADAKPGTEDGEQVLADVFNPMVEKVAALPFPTVAAVQGACMGTGLGLALACDVVLVTKNARIGSPFGKIGAVLDSGGHKAFVDRLGTAVAFDLIYSGRFLTGEEAVAAGLVSRALAVDELADAARDYARAIARGPRLAFAESKRLVRSISDAGLSLKQSLDAEAAAQGRASRTKDYVEGFNAFLERREPRFVGE